MFYWFWDRDGLESARIDIQDLVYPGMCHHRAASLTMSDIQDLVHPGMCHHWAASLTMSHIVSKFGTRNLMASKCPFKNLYKLEKSKSQPFLTLTDTCSRVCSSQPFLSFLSFCRRVRSGSGMSVISSSSVDQRLPEEPASEDEQQLEKKLPGERPTADWLMDGRNGNELSFWHLADSSAAHRQETDTFGTTVSNGIVVYSADAPLSHCLTETSSCREIKPL